MKRSVSDIAEEVFRFHHDLLVKTKTDSKDFNDEELRHLLQIIGQAKHNKSPDYELRTYPKNNKCYFTSMTDPL